MLTFPKYEIYKDSGVEWLGEIPSSWQILPLTKYAKSLVDYRGKTPTKVESGVFLVTAKNIKEGLIDYEISKEYVSENEYDQIMSRGKPKIGDLLFTTEAPLGGVALVNREDVALAQRVIKFRLDEEYLLPEFARYSMISSYFQDYLATEATGSTAQGIKASKLHKLRIITPPLREQRRIVEFLDRTTTETDRAISQKQRLIELLQEQKAILINQAVTKGLNPNVPMRDSGIEWIREIPENWKVLRLKQVSKIIDCKHLTAPFVDEGYPLASIQEVQKKRINLEKPNKTTEKFYKRLIEGNRKPLIGDIVYSRNASVGAASLVDIEEDFALGQDVCLFRSSQNDGSFFVHQLRADVVLKQLKQLLVGSTFNRINISQIKEFFVCVPPLDEQQEIDNHINELESQIDNSIATINKEIQVLRELASVFIAEAVTGKIKV